MTTIQAMQRAPAVTTPDATLRHAARRMTAAGTALLPVVESNGRLVGLATLFDIEEALDATTAAGPEPSMVKRVRGEGD
jgi:CBS domain-containing protein